MEGGVEMSEEEKPNRIRELRKKKGLTLKQFADAFNKFSNGKNVTYATISRWERGENNPSIYDWKKLAEFFNVDIHWIKNDMPDYNELADYLRSENVSKEFSDKSAKIKEEVNLGLALLSNEKYYPVKYGSELISELAKLSNSIFDIVMSTGASYVDKKLMNKDLFVKLNERAIQTLKEANTNLILANLQATSDSIKTNISKEDSKDLFSDLPPDDTKDKK